MLFNTYNKHTLKSKNEHNSTKFYIPFCTVKNGDSKNNLIPTISQVVQELEDIN